MTKEQAIQAKAKWLSQCLEFGWQKSDLDALSEVWDKFKDEYGNMRPTPFPISGSLEEAAKDTANAEAMPMLRSMFTTSRTEYASKLKAFFLAGALFERSCEFEMQRLYEWIMDDSRKGAIFAFTSGWLRNVAKEIEFRLASRPSLDIDKVVDELRNANPWDKGSDNEDKADKAYLWDDYCKKLKELLNQKEGK